MKIFDWIRGYFDKDRSRFRKKKQEQEVRDRITKTKETSQEEIQFPEHYLTHLDAPNHFAISGATPQDISLGFQQAPCVKIPLLDKGCVSLIVFYFCL